MRLLPYFLAASGVIAIHFLSGMIVAFVGYFCFGYQGSATLDKYEWLAITIHVCLAVISVAFFDRLKPKYGGHRWWFSFSFLALLFFLEQKGINAMSVIVTTMDNLGIG